MAGRVEGYRMVGMGGWVLIGHFMSSSTCCDVCEEGTKDKIIFIAKKIAKFSYFNVAKY